MPEEKTKKAKLGAFAKRAVGIEGNAKETLVPMINYNAASVGIAAVSQIRGDYHLLFLTKIEGLSTTLATLLGFIRSLWYALIDPFIGIAVDRTRSRLGRHRIYIVLIAVPFGITFSMLFTSFGISGKEGAGSQLLAYHLCTGLLFALVRSILLVSYDSMLPTLATGYFERTQYMSVQYIMNSVGMGPAQMFGAAMIGIRATRVFDAAMRPTMFRMGLVVGLVCIIPILYTGIATKELSSRHAVFPPLNVKAFFREFALVLKNRAFRQYFTMTFLYLFGSSFFAVSKPFFLDEVARRWDLKAQLDIWRGVAEMLMFPFNYAITKKFGKQKSARLTLPLLFVSFALGFLIAPQAPGSKLLSVAVMLFVREIFYIVGYSGYGFMVSNIYPDVTDVDELITGRRREATVQTLNSFVKTMTNGFISSIVGMLLEWFGVAEESTTVPLIKARASNLYGGFTPSFGLKLSNAFLPLVFLGLALLSLRKYTMTKQDHELIRRALAQRREEGRAEVIGAERAKLEEIAGRPWDEMWVSGAEATEPVEAAILPPAT